MVSYFWKKAAGANADIERHRDEERKLVQRIEELEAQDQNDPMVRQSLRTYRHFLCQLQQSKADAVDKIGRKNAKQK